MDFDPIAGKYLSSENKRHTASRSWVLNEICDDYDGDDDDGAHG